jgi:hypothetical protein
MSDFVRRTPGPPAKAGLQEALPPFAFRHRLIPAVHDVVAARFRGTAPDLCAIYAAVTALSANAALRGEGGPYSVRAGSVFVRIRGQEELAPGPAGRGGKGTSSHAWAGRRHPSGRAEVADLSTRQFNAWAASLEIPPEVRFPRAVWAFEDEVPRAFRYVADAEATARARESLRNARADDVADAVREVMERMREGSG